jgi:hypothetical protein
MNLPLQNLNENAQKWTSIITETLHIDKPAKVAWMAQYAANHEMFEAIQAGDPAAGIYSTPLNTLGMGNPQMPEPAAGYQRGAGIGNTGIDFHTQKPGSGDIPMSTLTMSLEIAAMTIGLELVPVIPANGPWALLSYMDFPYAGGKLGKLNETIYDGKGDGDANKPIFIKIKTDRTVQVAAKALAAGAAIVVTGADSKTLNATFIGNSRIDNGIIVRVVDCGDDKTSIADVFDQANLTIKLGDADAVKVTSATVDLVSGAADHVQGFANFVPKDGKLNPDPMSRAENETGVGNTIGARMFTRFVQMGAYEVTGSVTRQQLQDMPLYGVDVIGKVLEAMQNEISQHINNRILDRVFTLGVENAKIQHDYQNVDLNLFFGATSTASKALSSFPVAKYMVDLAGHSAAEADGWANGWVVKNATQNTAAENTHTHQRRIMSRCLAAANLIANVSRFGRGQWLVTNTQVLSALQDCAGFVVAPMTNTLTQDGSNSLYFAGSLAGLQVYVDPYMLWDDTRICVGRKSDGNTPGVIFMPYILADTVQTVVEGTMAPKILVNSRFAIVDAGFHCEQNYFTFAVDADGAYFL